MINQKQSIKLNFKFSKETIEFLDTLVYISTANANIFLLPVTMN